MILIAVTQIRPHWYLIIPYSSADIIVLKAEHHVKQNSGRLVCHALLCCRSELHPETNRTSLGALAHLEALRYLGTEISRHQAESLG